jgi:hypothetical protein
MQYLLKALSVSVLALVLLGCNEAHKKAAELGASIEEVCDWVYANHVVATPEDTRGTRVKSAAGIEWYNKNCP